MTWSMKADASGDYEQPPTGPQPATLTRIIDIGTHTDTSPMYGEQRRRQVVYVWELAEKQTSGEPHTIQKFYTLSMNEKANLRKDLESWRGQALGVGESIDIDAALGKACLLNVGTSDSGKAKVNGISRLPKGMSIDAHKGPLLLFRTDNPDWGVFEQLMPFHRGKIETCEEWHSMQTHADQQKTAAAATESNGPGAGDFDDDIPF